MALPDGEHAFTAVARGRGGEESAASAPLLVTVDGTAPGAPQIGLAPSSDTGAVGDLRTGLAHVTLVGRAEAGATVHLDAQGRSAVCGADGRFSLGDVLLEEGANPLTLRVVDAAGNATASNLVVDCVPGAADEADPVLAWSATVLDTIRMASAAPPIATRALALESIAVLDVVNALDGAPGYWVDLDPAAEGLSVGAAVAGAAHRVLAALFPGQQAALDAALALRLVGEPEGEARERALDFGEAVADAVLALRAGDGWNATLPYAGGTDPGEWRPTPPASAPALLPHWGLVTPFVLDSADQFRPDGPPSLTSAEYAAALEEVRLLGSATSAARTAEQTEIARFWVDGAGTFTPPGHWVAIAGELAEAEGYGGAAAARMLAVLNVALADSSIAAWDAKYAHGLWRPVTAIREAAADGNDATTADPGWTPLLTTPNHPEYVSGHSTYSAAGAEVLTAFFGEVAFETTGPGLPGVVRSFDSFWDAAAEAGRSRIYGGIHYEFSNQDGQATGRAVAELVLQSFGIRGEGGDPWA